ncbi:hypothetical protein RHMOL_Rhmol12G0093200 [Rhododendron molle]|uniref:Uncharacterized protein n=1 Tax=Rhododendron molle TaxID=49168 RepID=A0ACC0LGG4_RHOML|nr:hypothetical protein RHMOL_Rhmol12G0093200 [Rhododendron molle]
MSSTQRSEGLNAYFDGYIHSKTTLKQFVEQYENALANKVESENEEDGKSWRSFIPLITKNGLKKQFQSVYTNEKVTDLVEDSQEKYDKVMARLLELKGELIESSIVCGSNVISGTPNNSFSNGDGPSKESTNILDPVTLRRKGRPPSKRKIGVVEKKEVGTQERLEHNNYFFQEIGTQESVVNVNSQPSYVGQSMWPNMMPHNMRPDMA